MSENSNSPKRPKVYWQSSTKDPENIDLDEILNAKDDDEEGKSPSKKTIRKVNEESKDKSGNDLKAIIGEGGSATYYVSE